MRGRQFGQLKADLKAELGRNNDPGVRAADADAISQTLTRVYEDLYDEYDWPFLNRKSARIALSAGQRFYDFPEDIDLERLEEVVVWHNGQPIPLDRGIGFEHYAQYDPEANARCDPALRWDVVYEDEVEIWPLPASNELEIQFRGRRAYVQLVDDEDLCLLDSNLVVVFAAYELAPDDKRIKRKYEAATRRLNRLKARVSGGSEPFKLGLGSSETPPFRGVTVRISG